MPTQVPPGKLAARVREIVSAPPRKAAPAAAAMRVAVRDHGAPATVAPALPFEFGAVPVQQAALPAVAGKAESGAPHAGGEHGVEHAAEPRAAPAPAAALPPAAPKMEIKPKAAAPPPPKPEVPGARAERLPPPPPPPRSPGATPPIPAAAPLPAPRVALPAASAVRPPARDRAAETSGPPRRDLARVAPPSASPWIRIFHGLRQVADALLARALASRSEVLPGPAAGRAREGRPARDERVAEPGGEAATLATPAGEVRRWAIDAGAAAAAVATRPDAAGAAPFGLEASRIGHAARAVGAGLAAVRAWRAAAGAGSRARMRVPWTALESLLGRARAGDGGIGPAVSAAAASAEAEALAPGAASRPLAETGAPPLFAAVQGIERALEEAAHGLAGAGPGKDDTAAIPVEAMLERAAAVAGTAGAEPPAGVLPHPAAEGRHADEQRAPAPRVPPEKRARPERWELRIAATSTQVGVEDIARALGIARAADVRDVLAEGLSTRHQFVLWTRVGTTLTAALQRLVNDGLIETRIQPRG